MSLFHSCLKFACIGLLGTTMLAAADGPNPAETRLREQLRNTTLQLRSTQNDLVAAQAAQAALTDEKKALTDQLATVRKQLAAEKAKAEKGATELHAQVTTLSTSLQQYRDALEKARAEGQKLATSLRAAESENAGLKQERIELSRKVADREAKNLQMFIVANEILTRFEDFGLGRALAAREPFIGRTRVKLENLVQDFEDQLSAQRVNP
jgi:chromosome segregation ATPase